MSRSKHTRPPRDSATHRYTGPTTGYGLAHGTRCKVVGSKAGGKVIKDMRGKTWIVGPAQIERLED